MLRSIILPAVALCPLILLVSAGDRPGVGRASASKIDPVAPPAEPAVIPIGACCFQDSDTSPYTCIETTQFDCSTLPNSIWSGGGTICVANSCPVTGACCYEPFDGQFFCARTTQAQCNAVFHGTYLGDDAPCGATTCPPCTRPPKGMNAWWTMDEVTGGIAHDSASSIDAAYKPSVAGGPVPVAGMVSNALHFDGVDDYLMAPQSPSHALNCSDFTIDAWIRREATGITATIVNRGSSGIFSNGFYFYLNAAGNPAFTFYPGLFVGACTLTSTYVVPTNTWTHLTVTSEYVGPHSVITFYVNGVAVNSFNSSCVCAADSPFPTFIGSYQGGIYWWKGDLDEVEIIPSALTASEVFALYDAGSRGKCKTRVHTTTNAPFCLNESQITTFATICNDSAAPGSYNVAFAPLNGCTVPGPTVFTPLFSNPVNVPPGQCVTVQVIVGRPSGLNAVNQTACFQVSATDVSSGQAFYTQGSVRDRRDLCAVWGPCCIAADLALTVGSSMDLTLHVNYTDPVPPPASIPYKIQVLDSEDESVSQKVSLNGLPPGTRYIGGMDMQAGGGDVSVNVNYVGHDSLRLHDLILSADMDGDGQYEPVTSVGLRSVPAPCIGDVAPYGANGFVDIDDFTDVILNWGTAGPQGNTDGDDDVDIDDYTSVVLNWGPCD